MAKISVLMATYKERKEHLSLAIESILKQTYRDFEFIIILDNPDNFEHIELIKEYQRHDERIKFYINENNMGLPKTLNKGIKIASGQYLCRMDADDMSESYRLEKQLNYLCTNGYDLIGGLSTMIDEDGNTIYNIKSVPTDYKKIKKALKYNQVISHPTWFGKIEVFKSLNGYRMIPLCEDYDFTLRAVLKGYIVSNLNTNVLNYRMTKNSISRSNLYEQYLYMRYITNQYAKGQVAEISLAEKYVNQHTNHVKSEAYLRSNKYFNEMLHKLELKQYLYFCILGIKILFSSNDYLNKIYRLLRVSMYS